MKPKKTHQLAPEKKNFYFMGVTTIHYQDEYSSKSVTTNTLMETTSPAIRRQELDSLNRAALTQAAQQFELTQEQITRITIDNIMLLAHCTADEFNDVVPTPGA